MLILPQSPDGSCPDGEDILPVITLESKLSQTP